MIVYAYTSIHVYVNCYLKTGHKRRTFGLMAVCTSAVRADTLVISATRGSVIQNLGYYWAAGRYAAV